MPGTTADTPASPPGSGEFGRIARYFKPLAAGFAGARGLADDAAVFAVPPGRELVVTMDAMVAGIHFLPDDPPADIAAKLLRVNLSDLAAMGAEPLAYTLAVSLPRDLPEAWLAAFAAALGEDQQRYGIALAGGDSVSTRGPVTLAVTAFGTVPAGQALPRATARRDPLFVTGTIGDAALGLAVALGELEVADAGAQAHLLGRLRRPEPRLTVGRGLRGLAITAIDVSDGLVADLAHLAEESGCAAVLEAARVPLSVAARSVVGDDPALLVRALTGGDDYELLFTAPADRRADVAALAARTGVAIAEIGHLLDGPTGTVTVTDATGAPLDVPARGWVHF
ncbi:thiamine-phosphate kinase [Azospirillum halopraeferens]|uniref:thiamine-phosphate kinase n=1 Tax=Azospirillum halopraeferens TaxID=34010 RepID=UPI0004106AF0|nr:thiamine-phosphate kinase [Azospirillum halopraeferens]